MNAIQKSTSSKRLRCIVFLISMLDIYRFRLGSGWPG